MHIKSDNCLSIQSFTFLANLIFQALKQVLQFIVHQGLQIMDPLHHLGYGCNQLDIFGVYYILDTSKAQQKYAVVPAEEEARYLLRIKDHESLQHMRSQYLINVSNVMQRYYTTMLKSVKIALKPSKYVRS